MTITAPQPDTGSRQSESRRSVQYPRRVLFTGVGGSIGAAIWDRLREAGSEVIALSHVETPEKPLVADFSD
ncbi:MAG: hypothetical protein QOK29_2749, partial [Rhodospirillaceae bacterium]|nr:hypothetical protein [Rhodospirillaceae bacterium]